MLPRLPEYVLRPLWSLANAWDVKAVVSLVFALIWEVVNGVTAVYDELLDVDGTLVLMALTLYVMDWLTGLYRSMRDGEAITSRRFRGAGWKFIEYAMIVSAAMLLANGAMDTAFESVLQPLDDAALFYVGVTEFISVLENATGSKDRAIKIIDRLRALMRGEWVPQDDDTSS